MTFIFKLVCFIISNERKFFCPISTLGPRCYNSIIMDKSWITKPRRTVEYKEGLNSFLDFAFEQNSVQGRIMCPCCKCKFKKWLTRDEACNHLTLKQFPIDYTNWIWHGEDTFEAPYV